MILERAFRCMANGDFWSMVRENCVGRDLQMIQAVVGMLYKVLRVSDMTSIVRNL
jgi:hypothetical protein